MANGEIENNPEVDEPGIQGKEIPRLNKRGKKAVNAYLMRFAFLLIAGNVTALGGIGSYAYFTVKSIKSQANEEVLDSIKLVREDARKAAVATAITAVKDEKALQKAALAAIGSSIEAARAAGNLDGTVGQIRVQINGLQTRIDAITSSEQDLSSEIESLKKLLAKALQEDGYVALLNAIETLRRDSKGAFNLLNQLQVIFDKKQSFDGESGFISSGQIAICFGTVRIDRSSGPARSFNAKFPVDFIGTPIIATSINSSTETGFAVYGHQLTNTTYSGALVTVGDKNNNSISTNATVTMHYIAIGTVPIPQEKADQSNDPGTPDINKGTD